MVTRIIGFLPDIASLEAYKLLGKLLQINLHGLLNISDSVALCFVHLNYFVIPNDFQGSDDPAFHELLATTFPARASFE